MKYCIKCGTQIEDNVSVCPSCGTNQVASPTQTYAQPTTHSVAKCTSCGAVGQLKPGPLFRTSDIIWILLLLILAGAGLIYFLYILIVRGNPNKREKICKNCGSVNMFTYVY